MFEKLAAEVDLEYTDNSSIADVVDDFWEQFRQDPNDEIDHCQTAWVDSCCEQNRTVGELKKAGDWDDLYVALNPRKCGLGAELRTTVEGEGNTLQLLAPVNRVESRTSTTTALRQRQQGERPNPEDGAVPLDLMLLLRI